MSSKKPTLRIRLTSDEMTRLEVLSQKLNKDKGQITRDVLIAYIEQLERSFEC